MTDKARFPIEVFRFCPRCGREHLITKFGKAILCGSCGFEYFFNASGAVIAVIVNNKNEVLVTKRAHQPAIGTLDFPGGFIDPDETAEDCIVREIKEELNLDVQSSRFLYTLTNRYPYSGVIIHTIDLVFLVEVNDFSNIKAADDVSEYFFIPKTELSDGMFGMSSCNEVIRRWHRDKNF